MNVVKFKSVRFGESLIVNAGGFYASINLIRKHSISATVSNKS